MKLLDRIDKRRFVGREFLLFLWFESELFEGTLATKEHGTFGLWIDKQVVLTVGKEGTRIKGVQPASGREAKEALLRGKLPESASFHLMWREQESVFVLKAEALAIAGLTLPTVLGGMDSEEPMLLDGPKAPPPRKKKRSVEAEAAEESDEEHESFYERMHLTSDFEAVLQALFHDFLLLRLSPAWATFVVPTMRAWSAGKPTDADTYRTARDHALLPAPETVPTPRARTLKSA